MITYKEIATSVADDIICDICGKKYNVLEDDFEAQEFHHINFIGGYDSVFGDGNQVTCDICQHCLKEILGKYLKTRERDYITKEDEDEYYAKNQPVTNT